MEDSLQKNPSAIYELIKEKKYHAARCLVDTCGYSLLSVEEGGPRTQFKKSVLPLIIDAVGDLEKLKLSPLYNWFIKQIKQEKPDWTIPASVYEKVYIEYYRVRGENIKEGKRYLEFFLPFGVDCLYAEDISFKTKSRDGESALGSFIRRNAYCNEATLEFLKDLKLDPYRPMKISVPRLIFEDRNFQFPAFSSTHDIVNLVLYAAYYYSVITCNGHLFGKYAMGENTPCEIEIKADKPLTSSTTMFRMDRFLQKFKVYRRQGYMLERTDALVALATAIVIPRSGANSFVSNLPIAILRHIGVFM